MDPIKDLYNEYSFELNSIEKIVFGDTYVAVVLTTGFIGLSANLMNIKDFNREELNNLDFSNNSHRNVLNAYYNALLNNVEQEFINVDIFDFINFSDYSNIIMTGFSKPMHKKLKSENIKLTIFDESIKPEENILITSQEKQEEYIADADMVILTSTSLMNNTFCDILKYTNSGCDIFLFGASTLLSQYMFKYAKIKGLFGTVFTPGDKQILNIVAEGHGHRYLKKHGKKVALIRK